MTGTEIGQQQLAFEIDGVELTGQVFRIAVVTDVTRNVSKVVLVELDSETGSATRTYEIPFISSRTTSFSFSQGLSSFRDWSFSLVRLQKNSRSPRYDSSARSAMRIDSFFGERLQLAREFRGKTQKQLGDEVAASPTLISLCETGKKKDPAADLVEACGSVLGFEPAFFYHPVQDVFRENECSFRHRRSSPERLKDQIRAHATLIGMVIERLQALLTFPELNIPHVLAQNVEEIEAAAEHSRERWGLRY